MYYIGVDIGTTSTKSIVFDEEYKMISKSIREYAIYSTEVDYKEQKPKEIFQAVLETIRESIEKACITAGDINFISFSSMMHSIMAVDEKGDPITDCIIWADNRSVSYSEEFKKNGKGHAIYLRTGTPTHPMSPLYKLMWMKEKQRDIYKKAYKFISIKEYVFYQFFHEYLVDYSIASASGMFNIFDLQWDKKVLELLELNKGKLSEPVPTTFTIRNLKPDICEKTRLTSEVTFVIGASDGCLANVGSNAVEERIAAVTIGTSGAVRVISNKPVTDEKERVFCYVLSENKYVVGGAINNGGMVYRWFRDNFGELQLKKAENLKVDPYVLLNDLVEETEAGSNGLLFLPFLSGERAPYWNANLRGAYIGITDRHSKSHFARALIEGICYDMKEVLEAVEELVGQVKCIYANGGFTRSNEWVRILGDVFDRKLILSENYESSCVGAVMLGKLAVKEVEAIEHAIIVSKEGQEIVVREENREIYKYLYIIYKTAVDKLESTFEKLSEFQKEIRE